VGLGGPQKKNKPWVGGLVCATFFAFWPTQKNKSPGEKARKLGGSTPPRPSGPPWLGGPPKRCPGPTVFLGGPAPLHPRANFPNRKSRSGWGGVWGPNPPRPQNPPHPPPPVVRGVVKKGLSPLGPKPKSGPAKKTFFFSKTLWGVPPKHPQNKEKKQQNAPNHTKQGILKFFFPSPAQSQRSGGGGPAPFGKKPLGKTPHPIPRKNPPG